MMRRPHGDRDPFGVDGEHLPIGDNRPSADPGTPDGRHLTQYHSGYRVLDSAVAQRAQVPQHQIRTLADLDRADLIGAAEQARPAQGGQLQRGARAQRRGASHGPRQEQCLVRLLQQATRLVGRRTVHPEPHRHARRQ
ncbi:Uncharacterised protein [Mycobacteroides abscessus subsp. abscessus]|nr:Uncharacterised protein [Mycobacteroides abscessus subsp. abscessus]